MRDKCLLIKGPFDDDDLRELMQLLRRIEQRQPEETFHMMIVDDTMPVDEARQFILDNFPHVPGLGMVIGQVDFHGTKGRPD